MRKSPSRRALAKYKETTARVKLVSACLVNDLVPQRGREEGEKNPKTVSDELQKRPRPEAGSLAAPPLEEGGQVTLSPSGEHLVGVVVAPGAAPLAHWGGSIRPLSRPLQGKPIFSEIAILNPNPFSQAVL